MALPRPNQQPVPATVLTSLEDVDLRLNAVRAARIVACDTADIVEFDRLDRELDQLLLIRMDLMRQEAA